MEVLITGATGMIGAPTVAALLRRSCKVRLYSRHAGEVVHTWPAEVTAHDGDIADGDALLSAVRGCDAVIHAAGVMSEHGGKSGALKAVNVEGTRAVVEACERVGVGRLIYVSSLGADRGQSPYHQSKREAEALVQQYAREWVVLRPGNVYGPGDEVISLLLTMVRTLPAIPSIDGGEHTFQPIWVEDLAEALASSVDRAGIERRCLDVTGPDLTSMNDLIERMSKLTGRSPLRVPVPGFLGVLGARAAGLLLGTDVPLDASQVQMLQEGNRILDHQQNALMAAFDIAGTSLDEGLRRLADVTPEQRMEEGTGSMVRRHVWVDISDSKLPPEQLFHEFVRRFGEITPWHVEVDAEPGTHADARWGQTWTMHLPLRGNVQVRVVELEERKLTLATLGGHALAGIVQFRVEPLDDRRLRFHVEVHDRPANALDWVVMSTVGSVIQLATWRSTAEHVAKLSGGAYPNGVEQETETIEGERATAVEAWASSIIDARLRTLHEHGQSEAAVQKRPNA